MFHKRHGFVLAEVLIVVVILGILAAIVIAVLHNASGEARQTAFVTNIKAFNEAAIMFMTRNQSHLEDASSGELPDGLDEFIDERAWTSITPIGGVWDSEYDDNGITSGIGVHFDGTGETRDDEFMVEVDLIFDDGDLNTGLFRKIADDRYYVVLVD